MEIIYKAIEELIPYSRNSRTHSDGQISQIMASIKEFGFTNPILIDETNEIIAGHGHLMASQRLKLDEVPCIVLEGLTETQKKAYVIADNKIALNAGWDEDLLKLELIGLDEMGFDMDLIGFEQLEIDELIGAVNSQNDITITQEEVKPYKKYHILISIDFENVIKIKDILDKLMEDLEGIAEIEKSSN